MRWPSSVPRRSAAIFWTVENLRKNESRFSIRALLSLVMRKYGLSCPSPPGCRIIQRQVLRCLEVRLESTLLEDGWKSSPCILSGDRGLYPKPVTLGCTASAFRGEETAQSQKRSAQRGRERRKFYTH